MKTKDYTFTEIEILALKEGMTEFFLGMKDRKMNSPIFQQMQQAAAGLKEQFTNDYRMI